MRIVKQRLLEMLPTLHVFLDVDDLKEGRGAEYVDQSLVVLIFVSRGYFVSQNCMRELLRAMYGGKHLLALLEMEASHGGMTPAAIHARLLEQGKLFSFYEQSGLSSEMDDWNFEHPTPHECLDSLFADEPIAWDRIGAFQDVTMRLIAERLLLDTPSGSVMVQDELSNQVPKFRPPQELGRNYHIYASPRNPGAIELLQECARWHHVTLKRQGSLSGFLRDAKTTRSSKASADSTVRVSGRLEDLSECEHMCVYLTSETWTRGEASKQFADEVRSAVHHGIHLLLAHEMPGLGGQERRKACEFGTFFSCEHGETPQDLLKSGIYQEIAIPLRGGDWRDVSMIMLAQALIPSERPPSLFEASFESSRGRLARFMMRSDSGSSSTRLSSATAERGFSTHGPKRASQANRDLRARQPARGASSLASKASLTEPVDSFRRKIRESVKRSPTRRRPSRWPVDVATAAAESSSSSELQVRIPPSLSCVPSRSPELSCVPELSPDIKPSALANKLARARSSKNLNAVLAALDEEEAALRCTASSSTASDVTHPVANAVQPSGEDLTVFAPEDNPSTEVQRVLMQTLRASAEASPVSKSERGPTTDAASESGCAGGVPLAGASSTSAAQQSPIDRTRSVPPICQPPPWETTSAAAKEATAASSDAPPRRPPTEAQPPANSTPAASSSSAAGPARPHFPRSGTGSVTNMLSSFEAGGHVHSPSDLRKLRERTNSGRERPLGRATGDIPGGMQGDYV